jgi:hypothetical protein
MKLRRAPFVPGTDEACVPPHSPRITSAPFYARLEFEAPVDAYTEGVGA